MRYLKQLVLHGYKTFASRTDFTFDAGVTAVVGPNGSGKSNVADALRWVLGEQSYSTLRGKRTEDMIFSGSEQRARMGMAHVALTLDNSSGWLPIDFAEVEIARRAYRSGENEYYLNGSKVRLRDIAELLGSSGLSERNYTIIGQGLVDQALSQRPEERRKLFEEAAGITVHQARRDQASHNLSEAAANLTRARDIISELTPRLRYLKGQARRAQEYQQLKSDLEAQLQTWYGFKWREAVLALAAARRQAEEEGLVVEEQAAALDAHLHEISARRAERAALRDRVSEWHRASSGLHRQAEAVQRELAVRGEQVRLWREQAAELAQELVHLAAAREDGALRLAAAEAELRDAQASHGAQTAQVAEAQRELAARERAREAKTQALNQAQEATLALRTQLAERRSRLAQAGERRGELAEGDRTQAQAGQAAQAQAAELGLQLEALAGRGREQAAALAEVEAARQEQARALAAAQEAERRTAEQLAAAQRSLTRLQDQQDMLQRLRDEGAGLSAGVRAVLAAARRPREQAQLSGVLGTLGDLIEVPPELERAVEAALGGRVQDVVVEGWQDAEAAVDYLKRNQAGRATFLPLDTLRPGRAVDAPRGPGVIGLASALVRFDPQIRPAVELALNHTIIVEDLSAARRLLGRSSGATYVTRDGEIVRPSGSVTGGSESRNRDGGMLMRSRALRELPPQIAAAAARVRQHEAELAAARRAQQAARDALEASRRQRDELAAAQGRLSAEQNRVQLAAERARQTQTWHEEQRRNLARELAGLADREAALKTAIEELTERLARQEERVEVARREAAELAADDWVAELARLRAEAAVSAGQLQGLQARVRELSATQAERQREIAAKRARVAALNEQQAGANRVIGEHGAAADKLAAEIAALSAQIEPAEARLAQIEVQQRRAEEHEALLREQLRHAQMRKSQADLAAQRSQSDLTHLHGEIEKDLGLVALTYAVDGDAAAGEIGGEAGEAQLPLPLNGMVTRLPIVAELPDGLDRDVRNLRAQLARLGPVNLDALAEYNEVEARYNFLTTQAVDLEQAVASLQEVIAQLDEVMEREFVAAFKAIAAQFREEFVNLFGGGAAKIVLTDPDNPSESGIEIIARPPGKREQGLASLSGGERALTAAALIFSILKKRPTPFCVFDEVDAALDEANVGRFRDAIKALGREMQFILITHNRGTIEAADTIYGISMGADNTSQTLSLKLNGRELAPANVVEA
ncbi:MAG: Chromosome partition protein Smc [Chloroflexi bacterium ADurb.Bin325]|nr:MAG: Chromosome partition protein Smc [Chloroflexi bacterium ADurb.Bin325]